MPVPPGSTPLVKFFSRFWLDTHAACVPFLRNALRGEWWDTFYPRPAAPRRAFNEEPPCPPHPPESRRPPRVHADRAAGGDRHHRRPHRPARCPPCRRSARRTATLECQQPEAARPGPAQLPRRPWQLPAGAGARTRTATSSWMGRHAALRRAGRDVPPRWTAAYRASPWPWADPPHPDRPRRSRLHLPRGRAPPASRVADLAWSSTCGRARTCPSS